MPIGWTAEQTSWTKPGSVSSAERVPPPISSSASRTSTSRPFRASSIAAARPFGPEPITIASGVARAGVIEPGVADVMSSIASAPHRAWKARGESLRLLASKWSRARLRPDPLSHGARLESAEIEKPGPDSLPTGGTVPEEALSRVVTGVGLSPGTFADQLRPGTSLLVFLRHFGCLFCRETIADLRDASASRDDYPDVLFFFQGSATEGRAFLRRYWREARAIADPELAFYELFGVRRASYLEALGPSVLRARFRATAKGHEQGPRSGDIWRMPGVFAVEDRRIVWAHTPRHAADHPDFARLPEIIAATRARGSAPGTFGATGR